MWRNYYSHDDCPLSNKPVVWTDEWKCRCKTPCPKCDREIEPYKSVELLSNPSPGVPNE